MVRGRHLDKAAPLFGGEPIRERQIISALLASGEGDDISGGGHRPFRSRRDHFRGL